MPFPMPPKLGLQEHTPILSSFGVISAVLAPDRAAPAHASDPAWPPPITTTSKRLIQRRQLEVHQYRELLLPVFLGNGSKVAQLINSMTKCLGPEGSRIQHNASGDQRASDHSGISRILQVVHVRSSFNVLEPLCKIFCRARVLKMGLDVILGTDKDLCRGWRLFR